jgi:hypothetical protein
MGIGGRLVGAGGAEGEGWRQGRVGDIWPTDIVQQTFSSLSRYSNDNCCKKFYRKGPGKHFHLRLFFVQLSQPEWSTLQCICGLTCTYLTSLCHTDKCSNLFRLSIKYKKDNFVTLTSEIAVGA